jgi:hypothetical protein
MSVTGWVGYAQLPLLGRHFNFPGGQAMNRLPIRSSQPSQTQQVSFDLAGWPDQLQHGQIQAAASWSLAEQPRRELPKQIGVERRGLAATVVEQVGHRDHSPFSLAALIPAYQQATSGLATPQPEFGRSGHPLSQ